MQHNILLFSLLGLLVAAAIGVFVLVSQTGETSVPREEFLVGGIGLTENTILLKEEAGKEFSEDEVQKEDQKKESKPQILVDILPGDEKEEVQEEQIVWCEVNLAVSPVQNTVIFNEIAWMGTLDSFQSEWIELKNISEASIHIHGWQLFDRKKDIAIIFTKEHSISPNDFFILEKTNENTLGAITADFIYTGVLNNTNEALYIFDEKCVLQDSVSANPDWSAGDNSSRKSMERNQDLSWYTYEGDSVEGILGTPKKENSTPAPQEVISLKPEQSSDESYVPTNEEQQEQTSNAEEPIPEVEAEVEEKTYLKILISEVQVSGETARDEFIELYNPGDAPVDLEGWILKKKTSSGSESNLVSSAKFFGVIPAFGYFLVVPQAKEDGTPAYQGDVSSDLYYSGKTYSFAKNNTLLLYNPNKDLVDKVGFGEVHDYETAPIENPGIGESIGRKFTAGIYEDMDNNASDFEIQIPTPKAENQKNIVTTQEASSETDTQEDEESEFPPLKEVSVIVINEIAWAGTNASHNDEWIEIFNPGEESIDLTGWKLVADDGTPTINLSGEIPARGYYLLERTDDSVISDIAADLVYTGALNNTGEVLRLYDVTGTVFDTVDASSGWFAGDNAEKITMERINPQISGSDKSNWASNNSLKQNGQDADESFINGTPKQLNSADNL